MSGEQCTIGTHAETQTKYGFWKRSGFAGAALLAAAVGAVGADRMSGSASPPVVPCCSCWAAQRPVVSFFAAVEQSKPVHA